MTTEPTNTNAAPVTPAELEAQAEALLAAAKLARAQVTPATIADMEAVAKDGVQLAKSLFHYVQSQVWKLAGAAGIALGTAGPVTGTTGHVLAGTGAALVVAHAIADAVTAHAAP